MTKDINSYLTLSGTSEAEFKEKGSRFIGVAFPVLSKEYFEEELKKIKERYPKATHYCYAYKIGLQNDAYRINDDGEPSGTAGKQIFGQINAHFLTDTAIIVIRYYGGTKLGVTGLIQSYKTASSLAIRDNTIIEKKIELKFTLKFDQSQYNAMQVCLGMFKKIASSIAFISAYELEIVIPAFQEFQLNQIIFEAVFGFKFERGNEDKLTEILKKQA